MKKILVVLLMLASACYTLQLSAKGKMKVVYKGNTFVLEPSNEKNYVTVTDPITGNTTTVKVQASDFPVKMNGEHIYGLNASGVLVMEVATTIPLEEKIIKNLKLAIHPEAFPDGQLQINVNRVVVADDGNIVYTDYSEIRHAGSDQLSRTVSITNPDALFENIQCPVAMYNGKKVASRQNVDFSNYVIEIKNHVIAWHLKK